MHKIILIVCLVSLFASCKDAPILVEAGMYNDGKNSTLFTMESIYTVTSKKSGGGVTTRSGYTTGYLNAIDPNNGAVLQRLKIGDHKKRLDYIGTAGGKAWFFSYDPEIGLHARDPQSLEVTVSVKDIVAKNPALAAGITEQAYQSNLDSSGKFLFTTTKDGYTFLVDPVTLVASKADEKVSRRYCSNDIASNGNSVVNDSLEFSFSGSPRSTLEVTTKAFSKRNYDFFSHGGKDVPSKMLYYQQVGRKNYEEISLIDPRKLINRAAGCGPNNRQPLLADGNTFFVLSKTMLGNDYSWMVSAISIDYTSAKMLWSATIDGTEKVQSSDKEILHASFAGDKLVLVFENLLIAFNKKTGHLAWRKDIRTESN